MANETSRKEYLNQGNSFTAAEQFGGLEFAATTPGGGAGNRFALPKKSAWKLPTVKELLSGVALTKEDIRNSDAKFACIVLENANKPGTYKKFPVGYFTDRLPVVDSSGNEAEMDGFDGKPVKLIRPIGGLAQAWQQVPGEMVAYACYRALAWAQKNNVDRVIIEEKLDVTTTSFNVGEKSRQRACHYFKCVDADDNEVTFNKDNMPEVKPEEKIAAALKELKKAVNPAGTSNESADDDF